MKICLIGNPNKIFIKIWAEYYLSQNHEVHIIYIGPLRNRPKKNAIPGCSIYCVIYLTYIFLDLQAIFNQFQLDRLLKKIKPDILHVHYVSYHAWLASLTGFHPLIVSAFGSDIYIEAKNNKKNQKWVTITLKRADLILTTSKTFKKFIISNYKINPNKIDSFYWGQDLSIFKIGYENDVEKLKKMLNISSDTFVILSSRNMKPNYGIQYIVECIPFVVKKRKNVKFIFLRGTGSIEFEEQLKNRVKELNIEKYVIFIPEYLSSRNLAIYNNLADVVISLPVSDQFSGAVKEGMACGAIPIVHDLEVYYEHLKEGFNGFFVNREVSNEVAKKIIYCIDHHPELQKKFAKINRTILEDVSDWNKNKKLMLKIYKEILKKYKNIQ